MRIRSNSARSTHHCYCYLGTVALCIGMARACSPHTHRFGPMALCVFAGCPPAPPVPRQGPLSRSLPSHAAVLPICMKEVQSFLSFANFPRAAPSTTLRSCPVSPVPTSSTARINSCYAAPPVSPPLRPAFFRPPSPLCPLCRSPAPTLLTVSSSTWTPSLAARTTAPPATSLPISEP